MRKLLPLLATATIALTPAAAPADDAGAEPVTVSAAAPAQAPATAASPSLGAKFADAIFVRIPGVGISLATTGVYLGTSPLTFLMDVDQPAADTLVSKPWWFTSGRELGSFN